MNPYSVLKTENRELKRTLEKLQSENELLKIENEILQSENQVLNILKKVGAILTDDHFVYTSGKHGSMYIDKDHLYPHTRETSQITKLFAEKYKDFDVNVVAGPALGAVVLSGWSAYHLSNLRKRKKVLGIYTEKTPDKNQVLRRGWDKLVKDKNVLVVEDLTTTGGSVRKTVDSVKAAGGNIVGVSVMVNRDPVNITSEVVGGPFSALSVYRADAYDEEECPLCANNVPINTEIGHGREFLQKRKKGRV